MVEYRAKFQGNVVNWPDGGDHFPKLTVSRGQKIYKIFKFRKKRTRELTDQEAKKIALEYAEDKYKSDRENLPHGNKNLASRLKLIQLVDITPRYVKL